MVDPDSSIYENGFCRICIVTYDEDEDGTVNVHRDYIKGDPAELFELNMISNLEFLEFLSCDRLTYEDLEDIEQRLAAREHYKQASIVRDARAVIIGS